MELTGPSRSGGASLAALLLAVALLLSSCSSPDRSVATTTTAPNVPRGYELTANSLVTIGVRSLPTNFNPATPAGDNKITQMVMEQVWPQPFVTTPSFELETSGLLASAEVHSVSPLSVVYVINPKATWSDGTPITASDFIYDWQQHLHQSNGLPDAGLVAGYRDISSILGTDGGKTVTVDFKQPFSQWQELFSFLPPAQVAEQYGWSRAFASFSKSKVLSGGPFAITSFEAGKELTLSRNRDYWGPKPAVARIRFVVKHSRAAIMAGLRSGELSLAELAADNPAPAVLGSGSVGLRDASSGGRQNARAPLAWTGGLTQSLWQLCFNFDDPLTANILIRRGIEHALDRSEIVADSEGIVDPRARVAVSRLMVAGETIGAGGTRVAKAPDLYRPAAALASFRQAGYQPGTDGLMRAGRTGPPLVLDLLEPSGDWAVAQAGLVVQAQLGSLGIKVDVTKTSLADLLGRRLPKGDYEMALAPFAAGATVASLLPQYSNPVLPFTYISSPNVGRGVPGSPTTSGSSASALWKTTSVQGVEPGAIAAGGVTRDVMGFDSPRVDSYFGQALSALSPPASFSYLAKAEKILWRDVVTIPLFQSAFDLLRSARLDNVSESPSPAGPMWDAQDWVILRHLPKSATTSTVSSS